MKIYNHKQAIGLFYSTTQLSKDPQDRGMDVRRLTQIIEILKDCNCTEGCQKVLPGFVAARRFIEIGDIQAASVSLSATSEKIGYLTIPKNFLAPN